MTPGWLTDAHTAVCAGLSGDLAGLSGAEVVALAREVEVLRRRLAAVDVQVVTELESRAVAGEFARTSTADLLVSELRLSPGEAKARVARAGDLGPRRSLIGQPLLPLMPATAAAVAAGAISTDHVQVITSCLEQLPSRLDVAAVGVIEDLLVETAGHEHPAQLRRTATLVLARLDPDGAEPRADEQARRREVTLNRFGDGSGKLTGRLTPEARHRHLGHHLRRSVRPGTQRRR